MRVVSDEVIEDELRTHPNAGREIHGIAQLVPGETMQERVKEAQRLTIDYVRETYQGDTRRFIEDYQAGRINKHDLLSFRGLRELGLKD